MNLKSMENNQFDNNFGKNLCFCGNEEINNFLEKRVKKYFESLNFIVMKTSVNYDKYQNVDLIASKNNTKLFIQVKPFSYLNLIKHDKTFFEQEKPKLAALIKLAKSDANGKSLLVFAAKKIYCFDLEYFYKKRIENER